MALSDFTIKQGDLLPAIVGTLKTADGVVVDLTGGAVRFLMRAEPGAAAVVNGACTIFDGTDPETGLPAKQVQYAWTTGNTDIAGNYQGEFELTVGGKKWSFPNKGYLSIRVTDDIG